MSTERCVVAGGLLPKVDNVDMVKGVFKVLWTSTNCTIVLTFITVA